MEEMKEIQVRPLGQEDPLVKEMATHSSILAWKILWTEEAWRAIVHRVARIWTQLSNCARMHVHMHVYY